MLSFLHKLKLAQFWQQRGWLNYLLMPLSWLYYVIISLRCWLYSVGVLKTTNLPVPVIIVGNITVGGTGKTPIVIALVEFLRGQGYRPGVISRGYGGTALHYPMVVTADSDPKQAGDEPVLIALRAACPIVVDPKRVNAARHLLANSDCNIIISDDGLQHYALGRDIEIAVIDGSRRLGNALLLPAGSLREPAKRLQETDFILCSKPLSGEWLVQLQYESLYNLADPQRRMTLTELQTYPDPIHVVAGIGNPQKLFDFLRELGLKIIPHPFPDHYPYTAQDLNFTESGIVLMTEKDAVKCRMFIKANFWCLPVNMELDEKFLQALLGVIKTGIF